MKITLVASECPALEPWLIGYLGGEIDGALGAERRVLPARPSSFVQIILEGQLLLHDRAGGTQAAVPVSGLYGLLSQYRYDMEVVGTMRSISARLQPAAAGMLFGIDPVDLVDRFVPIELPDGLISELRGATDWQAMVAPLDRWFTSLVAGKTTNDPVAQQAIRLRRHNGQVPVQDLADGARLSLRHFQRRFRALTGLNPKHYARICRIGHAVHRKEVDPALPWTVLAMEAGYADQPHFIRDFKALTGCLPSDLLKGQAPMLRYPKWDDSGAATGNAEIAPASRPLAS